MKIKMMDGIVATSYNVGDKFYIDPSKLLPHSRFLPLPKTETGDTALMLAAQADQADCFLELIISGADLDLVSDNGDSAIQLAQRSVFGSSLADIIRQAVISRKGVCSTNLEVFSRLHFITRIGDSELLQMVLQHSTEYINKHDGLGLTPVLVAAKAGHTDAFRLLINHRADIIAGMGRQLFLCCWIIPMLVSSLGWKRYRPTLSLLKDLTGYSEFEAPHFAARIGNLTAIVQPLKM